MKKIFNFYQSKFLEQQNDKPQSDGFFLEGDTDKVVKLKHNTKSKSAKTRALTEKGKDNRLGQRERKKMTKAVYGKHTEGNKI